MDIADKIAKGEQALSMLQAKSLIESTKSSGQIFRATFIKKNGDVRDMIGRFGVSKYVEGSGLPYNPEDQYNVVVFDMEKMANKIRDFKMKHDRKPTDSEQWDMGHYSYRTINLETLQEIKINGSEFDVVT